MIDHQSVNSVTILSLGQGGLDRTGLSDLVTMLDNVANSPVRAVLLAGPAGAGGDARSSDSEAFERLAARLSTMPCLTIAGFCSSVSGPALGAMAACDLRLAEPGVRLGFPALRTGFCHDGAARRIKALIGPARARLILMCGAAILSEQALVWGLVDQIAPAAAMRDVATALAADAIGAEPEDLMGLKASL